MNERVVDGIQFFDKELKYLNNYEFEYVHEPKKKLTASSLVTYLLLRSLCDEVGLILEQDFNLKEECENVIFRIARYITVIIDFLILVY
ncbi:hypothetical protein EYB33_00845 (plasmid) [Lysinibacillus sphaericus]|uniref:hypothetical protein n=1 Tax=Lysinibacillus sphaericus TaxID=1421 RepID=UPI001E2D746D|nr:hypothetical protein [Lysinibacillus sphaericus]UDK94915.1 hypothetical protein EYB33_00845 [Lysinibacillus sphaericus]